MSKQMEHQPHPGPSVPSWWDPKDWWVYDDNHRSNPEGPFKRKSEAQEWAEENAVGFWKIVSTDRLEGHEVPRG